MTRGRLVVALLLVSTGAQAQDADALERALDDLESLVFAARFDDAVTAAEALMARADLTADQRNRSLEALAVAHLANRDVENAEATLRHLYRRDPEHRLSEAHASPPLLDAFARARDRAPPPLRVVLNHQPPRMAAREAPRIVVHVVEHASAVAELRLVYRADAEGEARVLMARRPAGPFVARIPLVGNATVPHDIAYRVEALAPSGAVLARVGTPAEPLQLRVPAAGASTRAGGTTTRPITMNEPPAPSSAEVWETWWFWTVLAVLVGGATAAALLATDGGGVAPGTLGRARLMVVGFDL